MPDNPTAFGDVEALLTNETDPVEVPDAVGVNVIVNPELWPDAIVFGNVIPLKENHVPFRLADEIVMSVELAVKVPLRDLLCPVFTLPKLRVEGLAVSCPAATPVPESTIDKVGFDASDTSVRLPLDAPPVCGLYVTV